MKKIFDEKGRKDLYNDIEDTEEDTEYIKELLNLLKLIDDIYESEIIREEDEDGKKVFPFALNYKKIQDFLIDKNNSLADRMSKVIDCTDNLIDRIEHSISSSN